MDTVEHASKLARMVFAVVAILFLIGAIVGDKVFDHVGNWIVEEPDDAMRRFDVFIACFTLLSLPMLVVGIRIILNGTRTINTGRFPPVGMWVIVDTPIETGRRARLRGRMLQVGGTIMCLVFVGLPIALWYIMRVLAETVG